MIETTLPLHLRLEIGQLRDRHVDVTAADVRRMPEVRGHADHTPVYPEPLVRPAVVTPIVPRRSRGQTARETLHPEFTVASHLTVSSPFSLSSTGIDPSRDYP